MAVGKYCGLHLDEIYVLVDVTPDNSSEFTDDVKMYRCSSQ